MPQPRHRQAPARKAPPAPRASSSWEKSADWYDDIIGEHGSELYRRVVIPGALGLLQPKSGEKIIDLGCGQGVFSRALATKQCDVTGVDVSLSLIERAKEYKSRAPINYVVRDAAMVRDLGVFDAASAILCVQNMPRLDEVCRACATVLKPGGRMLWVMNHPCFRIPKKTSWGYDEEQNIQYRRLDAYGSQLRLPIVMHPGQKKSETTLSFHLNLTDLMATAFSAGFVLAGLEEWISDKQSEPGPRAKAENVARMEFPLFMGLLWRKA